MIKRWFHILVISVCTLIRAQQSNIESLKKTYQVILQSFDALRLQPLAEQYAAMPLFFTTLNASYSAMIKQVHADLSCVKKNIHQYKKQKLKLDDVQYQDMLWLQNELQTLYKFLKKYRNLYEIVCFEQKVLTHFEKLFQAVKNHADIELMLVDFGILKKGKEGLKLLLKSVVKDLNKVEYNEGRLHADWIDAKLANYVLKIELVRLRNAILFHPSYKTVRFVFSSNYPR